MKIGVPKEIKNHECRVGLTPASVRELMSRGHVVLVQKGAELTSDAATVFSRAEMIVKVKAPQPQECAMLRPGQIL